MSVVTPLWHVAVNDLTPAQFERAKKICNRYGGIYCSALSRPSGKIPAGYVFQSQSKADAAAAEIERALTTNDDSEA